MLTFSFHYWFDSEEACISLACSADIPCELVLTVECAIDQIGCIVVCSLINREKQGSSQLAAELNLHLLVVYVPIASSSLPIRVRKLLT